jgi:hypothetical protein
MEQYKLLCASIYGTTMTGKKMKSIGIVRIYGMMRFVYSYDTEIIQLNGKQNNETIRAMVPNNEHTYELCDTYVKHVL